MKNLADKKLELLDAMLDDRIEMYGVINTIQYLLDNDFTKEELLEMKFDEVDIDEAIKEDTEDLAEDMDEEDLAPIDVRYEVWALGYDANENDFCTDVELLLGTYDDMEEAIKKAESFNSLDDVKKASPDDLGLAEGDYVDIIVETIKNDDPTNTNIDTAFLKTLI